jgi:hypothetical protein
MSVPPSVYGLFCGKKIHTTLEVFRQIISTSTTSK